MFTRRMISVSFHLISLSIMFIKVLAGSDIRLVRDGVDCTNCGRVEVNMAGQWGTVCSNLWSEPDARVVCRQLNFSDGAKPAKYAAFGTGTGPIHMSHVDCHGNETSLTQCARRGGSSCTHEDDAGVVCESDVTAELTGEVRLVDGDVPHSGRISIQYHGVWGTVCRDPWHVQNARVVCRQQGYCGGSSVIHDHGAFGLGSGPVWLADVNCTGREYRLADCHHGGWANNSCDHGYDVGVVCQLCSTGSMRLVGGPNGTAGIVAISNSGEWGTMCSDSWDDNEASVVCRSLGFGGGEATDGANFTYQTGSIWLSGVDCTGQEAHVTDCRHDSKGSGGWGNNDCRHYQDVAVACSTSPLTSPSTSTVTTTTQAQTTAAGPSDKKMDKTWVIVIVVILAIVVIAVIGLIVFVVMRMKKPKPQNSLVMARGEPNEYRIDYDGQEGACTIAPVRMPTSHSGKPRDSEVYDEIDEASTSSRHPSGMNSYTDTPGVKSRDHAVPLPAIPDENEYLVARDGPQAASAPPGQDVYTQIEEEGTSDYLEPLKLKH